MPIRDEIRRFIFANYLFSDDDSKLADGQSLMRTGIMDSTGILELIMHIEETYGVTIAEDEMTPANLDSVEAVVTFVGRKRTAA